MAFPRYIIAYGLVLIVVVFDQWTKMVVLATERFKALECLDRPSLCGNIELSPIMDLTMVWNRGISFGMIQSEGIMRWFLVLVSFIVICGFLVWVAKTKRLLTLISLGLIIGGAIGNMVDRIRFGAVVDFLNFSDIYFFYVFNIADASISCGAALLIIDHFFLDRHKENKKYDENEP